MKKQDPPNPFEHLRLTDVEYVGHSTAYDERRLRITENNAETAIIITSRVGEYWCGGFQFYWQHGNISYKKPDPANGLFSSEREARLYYIAYLSLFMDYYIDDTKLAINNALHEYSQLNLFE